MTLRVITPDFRRVEWTSTTQPLGFTLQNNGALIIHSSGAQIAAFGIGEWQSTDTVLPTSDNRPLTNVP